MALNLESEGAVRSAAERIGGPLLVQPFVHGGAELLAGHRSLEPPSSVLLQRIEVCGSPQRPLVDRAVVGH